MFMYSIEPELALYIDLLLSGNNLSFTIIPSILNDVALLITEPIFLGSVTPSKQAKVILFLALMNSFKFFSSNFSISATYP